MPWGENVQPHYRAGRSLETVRLSQIDGVCQCGYLTLLPAGELEESNGGLTVKRKQVTILRDDGTEVQQLRGVQRWRACNACVNNWK